MNWEDILKNIQISGQKGKTKDIRLPPKEEDEDCKPWFERLFKLCDDFLREVGGGKQPKIYTSPIDRFRVFSNEQLCEAKEDILRGQVSTIGKGTLYKHGEGGWKFSTNFIRFYFTMARDIPFVEITVQVNKVPIYDKTAFFDYDVSETYLASDAVIDLVSLIADINQHINYNDDGNNKSLIYATRKTHSIYYEWYQKNISKAIQIGRQKGKTKDIRLPPKEDDNDCRQWWRDLHKILNKMISAIDINATLVIDNKIESPELTEEMLCYARDKIMEAEVEVKNMPIGFLYRKAFGDVAYYTNNPRYGGVQVIFDNLSASVLVLKTYLGSFPVLFVARVNLLNDSMRAELERSVPEYPQAFVFDILKNFSSAELELKEHIKDSTMSLDLTAALIEFYEDYVREHFDISKSIQIGGQKGKTKDIRLPPKEEDDDCITKLIAMSKKIQNFRHERFPERNAMVKDDSLFWIGDLDLSEKPYATIPNNPDLLEINWEGLDTITEEEACLYLELIERYKNTTNVEITERYIRFQKQDYSDAAGIMITNDDIDSDNYLTQFGILIQVKEGLKFDVMDEILDIMSP